jgi:hypothetical protein
MQHLLGPAVLGHLPAVQAATLQGRSFFPNLIAEPFHRGLRTAFDFALAACLIGAAASWVRGGRYVYAEPERAPARQPIVEPVVEAELPI